MGRFNFILGQRPDCKLPVTFAKPNGEDATIIFTVRHLSSKEVQDMSANRGEMNDSEFNTKIASGWNLVEEFNEENALKLVQYYPSAAYNLTATYIKALAGHRAKI
ncbi:tail length tape measure protein [Shigella phage vB_SflS-ISF001]|uniref:Uncharacterized protein n=1 Tax=Shigella phage vB_SflS-ISF001 TaxID=2048005 RepID=A0A2D1GPY2_9CAUD|nr:tail length tape measure protein [Shigella phage vB_SflS-ISF001]ATN94106.1 hypothetical protein FLXISF001_028 [Shigella phage vB_SflS-ISF001]